MKRRIENNKNIQKMEQKDINIYEILKGVEYGTELYTPMCGKVVFTYLSSSNGIIRTEKDSGIYCFDKNGRWREGGEVMLFPSNEMRDWSKFFKKGDVLEYKTENNQATCLFDSYDDDTTKLRFTGLYTLTKGKIWDTPTSWDISDWVKSDNPAAYIKTIEERLGGKLNRETLEIEKPQPEFKDGDIAFADYGNRQYVFIVSGETGLSEGYNSSIYLDLSSPTLSMACRTSFFKKDLCKLRLATEEEKKQFFSSLEKEGKAWDADKKQVVDLKPAFEIGKLYVFNEDDEDGELTIIGKLIDKNESEDTLTFGNQYEIENEKFVTDQAFDLRISVNKELRESTENEVELFNKHYAIWKKEKEAKKQPAFKVFDKVLVRDEKEYEWIPALFVRDRGEGADYRYEALSIHSGKTSGFSCCIPFEGHENIAFTDYDIENLPF